MHAALRAIEYHLPARSISTADLAAEFPDWSVEKIDSKTGIQARHVTEPGECASDLAVCAVQKLFNAGAVASEDIDYLLLCTQSPDYFLPTTACLLQDRLGIPKTAGAVDFNLGCSGYIYGLGLAEGLISTGQASKVLLITAETYSKFLNSRDRSVRTIFGDAAAATLLVADSSSGPSLGPFVYGTDGSGGPNLMVPAGGMRRPITSETSIAVEDDQGNVRSPENLFMDGPEIFNFTLSAVPDVIARLLERSGRTIEQIDLFVFHQANRYMLDHLRKRMRIPPEKFWISMAQCGNTVSSTIPIALKHAEMEGRTPPGTLVMMVGFGVGYSWGATLLRYSNGSDS
jgi:3-oxoacyl-[acyl-carrier-protein] synthase III